MFARAQQGANLDHWAETLQLLAAMVKEPSLAALIGDPMFARDKLVTLLLDIAGDQLDGEGQNLVKLLVQNGRLPVLPEIAALYATLKAESQRILSVHIISAYALQEAQEKHIAEALKRKLGRDITITSEQDDGLIGGVHIRAGDMVIDGSVRGKLQQLANELGI